MYTCSPEGLKLHARMRNSHTHTQADVYVQVYTHVYCIHIRMYVLYIGANSGDNEG